MNRSLLLKTTLIISAILVSWACGRGKPLRGPQARDFQGIKREYDQAMQKITRTYQAAKSDAERGRALDKAVETLLAEVTKTK